MTDSPAKSLHVKVGAAMTSETREPDALPGEGLIVCIEEVPLAKELSSLELNNGAITRAE
jgi:hypothetical protein